MAWTMPMGATVRQLTFFGWSEQISPLTVPVPSAPPCSAEQKATGVGTGRKGEKDTATGDCDWLSRRPPCLGNDTRVRSLVVSPPDRCVCLFCPFGNVIRAEGDQQPRQKKRREDEGRWTESLTGTVETKGQVNREKLQLTGYHLKVTGSFGNGADLLLD